MGTKTKDPKDQKEKEASLHAAPSTRELVVTPPEPVVVPEPEPLPPYHLLRAGELSTLLQDFASSECAPARVEALCRLLQVQYYQVNPRTLVWVDYCFGILTFGKEDAQFSEEQTLQLLHLANEIFEIATTQSDSESAPSLESVYNQFRTCIHAQAASFSPQEIAKIVDFMSSTFFRHLKAYQYVFRHTRDVMERTIELTIETPMPPLHLDQGLLMSQFGVN